jgi:hypothetical protein
MLKKFVIKINDPDINDQLKSQIMVINKLKIFQIAEPVLC